MSRKLTRLVLAAVLAVVALGVSVSSAAAPKSFSDTRQFDTEFTVNTNLLDTHLLYIDGPLPGRVWFRLRVGLQTKLEIDSRADINLSGLNDIAAGDTLTVQNALIARGANVKDFKVSTEPFVNLDLAYDLLPRRCPASQITTDAELSAASARGTCLDLVFHTGNFAPSPVKLPLLRENGLLPYSGNEFAEQVNPGFTILDIGAFIGVPNSLIVTLDSDTQLTLNAPNDQGWLGNRQISPSNSPGTVLSQRVVHWTSTSPINDTIQAQCTWPVGQNLIYRVRDLRWKGTATVDLIPQISLRIKPLGIPGGIVLFGYDLPAIKLFDQVPVSIPANEVAHTMGKVLPDSQAPTVSAGGPYAGAEGSPVAFAAAGAGTGGSFDNCDPTGATLSYSWSFGDGGTATGKSPSHTFADNGSFAGTLTVSDGPNSVVTSFTSNISNVAPVASFSAASVVNGGAIDANLTLTGPSDPSTTDTAAGLQYAFDCGSGYGPLSLTSTAVCPGVIAGQPVKGKIADKDGGSTEYSAIATSPLLVNLNVIMSGGDGTGTVTSSPAGIACPADCDEAYGLGSSVDLTAQETPTDEFAGWRSCDLVDATDPRICHMSMTAVKHPTAVFREIVVPTFVLSVATSGTTAGGLVSSDVGGIVCTPACSGSYAPGTVVTLTAIPSSSVGGNTVTFLGWGATCPLVGATANVCIVTMDAAKSVTASFFDTGF